MISSSESLAFSKVQKSEIKLLLITHLIYEGHGLDLLRGESNCSRM